MKNYLIFIFLIIFVPGLEYLKGELSRDAINLALRQQNSIRLDYNLCSSIDSMLISARQLDTNLKSIYTLPQFTWNNLFIRTQGQNIEWVDNLSNNGLISGDAFIDSLNKEFHLIKAEDFFGTLFLTFNDTLRADLLAKVFEKHPDIWLAQPNYIYSDFNPDNIYFLPECGENKFVFSKYEPWGGFWYIQVDWNEGNYYSKLVKTDTLRSTPKFFLWNIPGRYNCSVFSSVDEIKDSINKSQNWWIRRHGIETSKLLFKRKDPWVGEDNSKIFRSLKAEIEPRWREFITLYQNSSENDECSYVMETATNSLEEIKLPQYTKCLTSEILDSNGYVIVKLTWANQFRDIQNYKLEVLKLNGNLYSYYFIDSTIKDTTYLYMNVINGKYKWRIQAKNEFGWFDDYFNRDIKIEDCNFEVTSSDVLNDNKNTNYLKINPNTAKDFIEFTGFMNPIINRKTDELVIVYNLLGEQVINYEFQINNNDIGARIDVSNLPPGIYFVRIGDFVGKFVKVKK